MAPELHDDEALAARRARLVDQLQDDITDERILDAIGRVPRERFVDAQLRGMAYENRPLPIGHGQTTSQPLMIALMMQEMDLEPGDRVLEVGAGCGYQTALLAELVKEVVGVELIPSLCERATKVLVELGYENATIHMAGDALGWPQEGPYDAIVVAAASPRIPAELVDQLAPDGRIAIPVGDAEGQDLLVAEKRPEGMVVTRKGACRFVPLIGKDAFTVSNN